MKKGTAKVNFKDSLKTVGKFMKSKRVVAEHGKTKEYKMAMQDFNRLEKLASRKVRDVEFDPCAFLPVNG